MSWIRSALKTIPGPALLSFLIISVLITYFLVGFIFQRPTLIVRDAKTGETLEIGRISEGDSFELHFIHSVDILPVHDVFKYQNGELVLSQTRCLSFGAGLGYAGQGVMRGEGKWNIIDNMDREVGALPLRVGTIADHTIVYRGTQYHLDKYFTPQSLVYLEVVD